MKLREETLAGKSVSLLFEDCCRVQDRERQSVTSFVAQMKKEQWRTGRSLASFAPYPEFRTQTSI